MTVVGNKFENFLDCEVIDGSETYHRRISLGLKKTHYNDAFVIAGG